MAPSLVKDYFRNAPLLDFMAPTIKVKQIIAAERRRRRELHARAQDGSLHDLPSGDRQARVREVSRSRSRRIRTSTTYLGSDSPHPMDQVGCTCATRGWASPSASRDASHTPRDEKQEHEWEEKYHWEEPHLWDYPMLPDRA